MTPPPLYPPPPIVPPSPPSHPPSPPGPEATALDISLIVAVLLAALLLQQALKSTRIASQVVTGSGLCMLLGAGVNLLLFFFSQQSADLLPVAGQLSLDTEASGSLAHDVIYFGLLPPIIFEAGFHMRKRTFFANFFTIAGYAVGGTLIALLTTGSLVYLLSSASATSTRFTLAQAMVFGSLISSTDPVATLGILKHVRAAPLLHDLIFGESALNDALSIVLFNVFFAYTKSPLADQSDAGVARAIGWVLTDVLRALAGSVSLGLALALACAYLTRRLKALHGTPRAASHALELALLLGFALLAFTFSERCGVSGVMALFFCAVAMRHYTYYNLSKVAQHSASVLFTTLSEVSEASLAVLLGVAAVDYVVKGHPA